MIARAWRWATLMAVVFVLAFFFANVEVQIEGAQGWAAGLPVTFRIDSHWALDWLWGGRPMTGYHAWIFPFMLLVFHLPCVMPLRWSPRLEAQCIGCFILFWVIEDALWFAINPAYGWAGLRPGAMHEAGVAWWHTRWFLGLPVDYWMFTPIGAGLLWWGVGANVDASSTPGAHPNKNKSAI